jgi:Ca2+-transporting ATPase
MILTTTTSPRSSARSPTARLYDNLLKYLRFQMSTLVAYIAIFIGRRHLRHRQRGTAEPAADPVAEHGRRHPARDRARASTSRPRLMARPPRPVGAPVLSRNNWSGCASRAR